MKSCDIEFSGSQVARSRVVVCSLWCCWEKGEKKKEHEERKKRSKITNQDRKLEEQQEEIKMWKRKFTYSAPSTTYIFLPIPLLVGREENDGGGSTEQKDTLLALMTHEEDGATDQGYKCITCCTVSCFLDYSSGHMYACELFLSLRGSGSIRRCDTVDCNPKHCIILFLIFNRLYWKLFVFLMSVFIVVVII